jgi:Spx/MgsR family transcriptional regulator
MTQPTVTLYGIPNCSTVRKARAWLTVHQIAYQFHDFKKAVPDADLIADWLQDIALDALLNRKGTSWRQLDPSQRDAAAEPSGARALMMAMPSVIKRPVLTLTTGSGQQRSHVGFSDALYQHIFQPQS